MAEFDLGLVVASGGSAELIFSGNQVGGTFVLPEEGLYLISGLYNSQKKKGLLFAKQGEATIYTYQVYYAVPEFKVGDLTMNLLNNAAYALREIIKL